MSTPSEAAGRPASTGVIHDLGYQSYEGVRLGRRDITRALYVESAKGAYGVGRSIRTKVMPILLLVAISLPALIIVVVAAVTKADKLPGGYTSYVLNVSVLVMIFLASQAPASVSRDLRFRVMPLYFSRPMQRIDYVVAKFAAMITALFVLMALPLTILFVGALLAKLPIGDQVPDYLRAIAGALMVAAELAGIGLVIAAITPRRGLGVAAIIAVLAILSGVEGAVQAIAVEQHKDTLAGYAGLLSPFTLVDGVQSAWLGSKTVLAAEPPGTVGGLVFLAAWVLLVAGSFGVLVLRYRRTSI